MEYIGLFFALFVIALIFRKTVRHILSLNDDTIEITIKHRYKSIKLNDEQLNKIINIIHESEKANQE